MTTYSEHRPTVSDRNISFGDERDSWYLAPCSQTRDSCALTRSNWENQELALTEVDDSGETWEIHRYGHWGPGWYEIAIVKPNTEAAKMAEGLEAALAVYPVLDETDYAEKETTEANEIWENCYNESERIAYIREHRSQFDFDSWSDLCQVVRGKYFAGYASELCA